MNDPSSLESETEEEHRAQPKSERDTKPEAPEACTDPSPNGVSSDIENQPEHAESIRPHRAAPARARFIEASSFPDQPRGGKTSPPATIENVAHLLRFYGITARYNLIGKRSEIAIPGHSGTIDNYENTAMTEILSLAMLNGLPSAQIPAQVQAIADRNAYNPVADWILSKPWDGIDRLPDFYATVVSAEGFPVEFKETLLRTWLLSATAAALKRGFYNRGVLTFQGDQGIGKTTWVRSLISDPILRDQVVMVGHHLDAGNKDSLLAASAHWLVELGELDSSFKRDVARLKSYLTSPSDKIRAPYARAASEFPRRTVFYATVNAREFLVDDTGNTRFWVIPVESLDFRHQLDMQQVFAQLAVALDDGAEWWLGPEDTATLERLNRRHRSVSVIRETLLEHVDPDHDATVQIKRMTPIALLREIGIRSPSNAQARECGAILREWLGDPTKIRGEYKWPVPMRQEPAWSPHATTENDDDY